MGRAASRPGWIAVALAGSFASGFWCTFTGAPVVEIEKEPAVAVAVVVTVSGVRPTQASKVSVAVSVLASPAGQSSVHWNAVAGSSSTRCSFTTRGTPALDDAPSPTENRAEPLTGKKSSGRRAVSVNSGAAAQSTSVLIVWCPVDGVS